MNPVLEYGPRLLYSFVLVGLVILLSAEVWRIWTDDRLYISAFNYERDGSVQKEAGASFARRVGYGLRRVSFIYRGAGSDDPPLASTDQLPSGLNIDLPALRTAAFESVEVQAYGVNLGSLLRSIRALVHRPNEISGDVLHYGEVVDVHAALSGTLKRAPEARQTGIVQDWAASGSSVGDASFKLSCGVFRYVAAAQHPYFSTIGDDDFCQFIKALEHYQTYRSLVLRNAPDAIKDEHLHGADELVQPLLGSRFPFAEKLAGLIQNERKSYSKALDYFNRYLSAIGTFNQTDKTIVALVDRLTALKQSAGAAPPSNQDFNPRSRVRPLTAGVSISSTITTAGTLCCFVREVGTTEVMALTADHVVGDAAMGTKVLQPGSFDGGTEPDDVIGEVYRILLPLATNGRAAGALIRLEPTRAPGYSGQVFGIQRVNGVELEVTPGMTVSALGRTSGYSRAKVTTIHVNNVPIRTHTGTITLNEMIMTEPFSEGGDSGAPVFTEDGKLIGLVYAGGEEFTLIMPIQPILDGLGVELVQE